MKPESTKLVGAVDRIVSGFFDADAALETIRRIVADDDDIPAHELRGALNEARKLARRVNSELLAVLGTLDELAPKKRNDGDGLKGSIDRTAQFALRLDSKSRRT